MKNTSLEFVTDNRNVSLIVLKGYNKLLYYFLLLRRCLYQTRL